jgi:NAD(P)H-flavin reductase
VKEKETTMTYRELAAQLSTLTAEQLDMDVTVYIGIERETQIEFEDSGEAFAVNGFNVSYDQEAAVLDPDHPYLALYR